jgi:hypothetical protein
MEQSEHKGPALTTEEERKRNLKLQGWIFLVGGLVASGIVGSVKPASWRVFGDYAEGANGFACLLTTGCWVVGIVGLIRSARIKIEK